MATIEWLGHSSFRITGGDGKVLYIDPWKLKKSEPKADLILISHSHFDHLSVDDVKKIQKDETRILCSADCAGQLKGNVQGLKPGATVEVGDVRVKTTHAYNRDKEFHPAKEQWLGFLLTMDGETIYYCGDSDLTPEMEKLGKVDIAMLPVGGTYTMTAAEAAQAAARIKPGKCIPYHYGDIVGSDADAAAFAKACGCPTEKLAVRQ
jgi:L-ascorbate metabolism protein UlaG (beta-lactamase superfamily)